MFFWYSWRPPWSTSWVRIPLGDVCVLRICSYDNDLLCFVQFICETPPLKSLSGASYLTKDVNSLVRHHDKKGKEIKRLINLSILGYVDELDLLVGRWRKRQRLLGVEMKEVVPLISDKRKIKNVSVSLSRVLSNSKLHHK